MSLKSEIVVDKVSPLGGLFEVKGKLQIKKQDDDRPIFEIDPNAGTISNDGFILSNNDIDIPVEIKSDYPIQVQIDNNGIWIDVENI